MKNNITNPLLQGASSKVRGALHNLKTTAIPQNPFRSFKLKETV